MQKWFIVFSIVYLMVIMPGISQDPGDILWQLEYGGDDDESFSDVQQTADGGYVAVGFTSTFGPVLDVKTLWVVKTDATGGTEWMQVFGGGLGTDEAQSVVITADGGYLVVGKTTSYAETLQDAWILKLDSAGDTLWTRQYSGPSYSSASTVIINNEGNYLISGYAYNSSGNRDGLLLKYDPDGNLLWHKIYGGAQEDWTTDLRQTDDDGYILTGVSKSFGAGDRDLYLVKTDSNGDMLWSSTYGGPDGEWGWGIELLPDGGYIMTGWTGVFFSTQDIWLVRTDADGDIVWTKTYDFGSFDMALDIIRANDGGYVITGVGNDNFIVLKVSESGEEEWINNSFDGSGQCVIENNQGEYIVTGQKIIGFNTEGFLMSIMGETMNQPPAEFSLLEPQDGDTLASLTDPVEFVWESSNDPDNDSVYYTLTVFNPDINFEFPLLVDTTYTFDGSTIFEELTDYQWTVSASDGGFIVVADTFTFVTPLGVGIDELNGEKQHGISLNQNYPNPFKQETIIKFTLDEPMQVTLEIFNIHGQKVTTLVAKHLSAGTHRIKWDGTDVSGNNAPKGIYLYRFNGDGFIKSYKMFLTR